MSTASGAPASNARWRLLKRALVSAPSVAPSQAKHSDPNSDAADGDPHATADVSVRRHAGFKLFESYTLKEEQLKEVWTAIPHGDNNDTTSPDLRKYHYQCYHLPSPTLAVGGSVNPPPPSPPPPRSLYFRLRRPDSVRLAELAPSQAVDNTGNICIWNSEEVLTHLFLNMMNRPFEQTNTTTTTVPATTTSGTYSQEKFDSLNIEAIRNSNSTMRPPTIPMPTPTPPAASLAGDQSPSSTRPIRILELGAGMSGLCGLAIAYQSTPESTPSSSSTTDIFPRVSEVLITDGNPSCIDVGVQFQIDWNRNIHHQRGTSSTDGTRVTTQVLQWDRNADYSHLGRFDVILAADCLFFRAYHLDLCHVLRSLLVPDTGRAFLLAPTRGGSLQTFLNHFAPSAASASASSSYVDGLEVVDLAHRYDEEIWRQHQTFLQQETNSYAIDLHYPLLLTLRCATSS